MDYYSTQASDLISGIRFLIYLGFILPPPQYLTPYNPDHPQFFLSRHTPTPLTLQSCQPSLDSRHSSLQYRSTQPGQIVSYFSVSRRETKHLCCKALAELEKCSQISISCPLVLPGCLTGRRMERGTLRRCRCVPEGYRLVPLVWYASFLYNVLYPRLMSLAD